MRSDLKANFASIFFLITIHLLAWTVSAFPAAAHAALKASEVAVLAVRNDPDSMKVAEHYMQARNIPQENLILLEKSYPMVIPRTVWDSEIRPTIQTQLKALPGVKCVVCAWSVPLRIEAPPMDSPRRNEQLEFFRTQEKALAQVMTETLRIMHRDIAPTQVSIVEAESVPDVGKLSMQEWLRLLQTTLQQVRERVAVLPETDRKAEMQKLDKILQQTLGFAAMRNLLIARARQNMPIPKETFVKIMKVLSTLEKHMLELHFRADSPKRDAEMLLVTRLMNGPYSAMLYARECCMRLEKNESQSAFDSELSLIFETESYSLLGWVPNLYAYQYRMPPTVQLRQKEDPKLAVPEEMRDRLDEPASSVEEPLDALPLPPLSMTAEIKTAWGQEVTLGPPPAMDFGLDEEDEEDEEKETEKETDDEMVSLDMTAPELETDLDPEEEETQFHVLEPARKVLFVARLEGPSVETVLKLIDDSIAAEKKGLEGTVYLDARKTRPARAGAGQMDKMEQSLNDLAIRLQRNTDLVVKLDTEEALFMRETCDSPCALYCGWYSVRNFQDIFTFSPGAVAYHVASFEAESLKTGPFWCPNLLEHGAAATLGPTFEPYLAAFPEPDEFYSLVLTGKFTMAECFYITLPFHSWAMTYVGDPLYTPYRAKPRLKMEELPVKLQRFFSIQPQ